MEQATNNGSTAATPTLAGTLAPSPAIQGETERRGGAGAREATNAIEPFFDVNSASSTAELALSLLSNTDRVRTLLFSAVKEVKIVTDSSLLPMLRGQSSSLLPDGSSLLLARYSAVSAGTELLLYRNKLPHDQPLDPTLGHGCELMSYPTEYGYAMVATVHQTNPTTHPILQSRVFSFSPHKTAVVVQNDAVMPIPAHISDLDAVFLPNMETALSLCMDAAPILLPGATALVLGAGIVGCLVAGILQVSHPLVKVTVAEPHMARRSRVASFLGFDVGQVLKPEDAPRDQDVVFEVSGHESGLSTALQAVGSHGRIVLGSWFGSPQVHISGLGGSFHRSHATIVASQVSEIPSHLTGRWSKERRFEVVWRLIAQIKPKRLITHVEGLDRAPTIYKELDASPENYGQVVFEYGTSPGVSSEDADTEITEKGSAVNYQQTQDP